MKLKNIKDLDIVLHIGFHKTGTTYLQKYVFPNLKELIYLGRSWVHKDLNQYFYDFYYCSDKEFDVSKFRERFYSIVADVLSNEYSELNYAKAIFLSHESLHCGSFYFGEAMDKQSDRIKAVFPNAKIIIGIRDQVKMIESHYTNYIHHGGKLSFNSFYKSKSFLKGLKLKLEYDQIVDLYIRKFGRERVRICVFEAMFTKQGLYLDSIFQFLGVSAIHPKKQNSVNPKLSGFSISIIRLINMALSDDFFKQYESRLRGDKKYSEKLRWFVIRVLKKIETKNVFTTNKKSKFQYLDNSKIEELRAYYFQSNQNIEKIINVQLSQYGYYE